MRIARSKKEGASPTFIITICTSTILGLLMIALGLLYYQGLIDYDLAYAQSVVLPKEYLLEQAKKRDLDYDLLYNIIDCESNWRMVKNNTSSAFGFFQILDRTEKYTPQYKKGLRKFDPFVNIDMGLYLYQKYGVSPWQESRACWGSR